MNFGNFSAPDPDELVSFRLTFDQVGNFVEARIQSASDPAESLLVATIHANLFALDEFVSERLVSAIRDAVVAFSNAAGVEVTAVRPALDGDAT